jgi:hypothetical protein
VLAADLNRAIRHQRDRIAQGRPFHGRRSLGGGGRSARRAVIAPRQSDDEARTSGGALGDEVAQHAGHRLDERRAKDEIFRGVADQHQLGEDDEIGAARCGLVTRGPDEGGVAGEVANRRIDLGERDREQRLQDTRSTELIPECTQFLHREE